MGTMPKNEYKTGMTELNSNNFSYVPIEGSGGAGSYKVTGNYRIIKTGSIYSLIVMLNMKIFNNPQGKVNVYGSVILFQDRNLLHQKDLKVDNIDHFKQEGVYEIGVCSFALPQFGEISIDIHAGYVINTGAGRVVGSNLIKDIKKVITTIRGKATGKVIRIYP